MKKSSTKKSEKDLLPTLSFRVIKLKKTTPKISLRLLSYVMNSLLNLPKFCALGIAIALLIMAKGMALANPIFSETSPK